MVSQIQNPEKSPIWSLPSSLMNDFIKRSQALSFSGQQLALNYNQVRTAANDDKVIVYLKLKTSCSFAIDTLTCLFKSVSF